MRETLREWKTLSTTDLVRLAKEGEHGAREEVFARYSERVLDIVRARLGKRLRLSLDSRDILQEALADAVAGLERFEMQNGSSLIRWLSTIVEHQIVSKASYHRAEKRCAEREVPIEGGGNPRTEGMAGLVLQARGPTPSGALVVEEREHAVQECLAELPEHYREVILLHDYAGESWGAVAAATKSASANAARMLHSRAVASLGRLLRERGID